VGEHRAFGDIALQPDAVRKPDRQCMGCVRCRRRHLPTPHCEAALTIKRLAGFECTLGDRHDIRVPDA